MAGLRGRLVLGPSWVDTTDFVVVEEVEELFQDWEYVVVEEYLTVWPLITCFDSVLRLIFSENTHRAKFFSLQMSN